MRLLFVTVVVCVVVAVVGLFHYSLVECVVVKARPLEASLVSEVPRRKGKSAVVVAPLLARLLAVLLPVAWPLLLHDRLAAAQFGHRPNM